jgi:DNA-binding NarL/FixJ family response regulator
MENKEKIKVHIVEDHQIFREGLKAILAEIPYVLYSGESANGLEFITSLSKEVPDIVFMDLKMPVMDGVEATEEALTKYPDLKIIVLTLLGEEEIIHRMIQLGISGFMLKNSDKESIEKALQQVLAGNHYFSGEIMSAIAKSIYKNSHEKNSNEAVSLSEREIEVINLLCKGYANKMIGEKLFISPRTVEGYKSRLMQKTGHTNSVGLILWAMKNNIVSFAK